MRSRSWCATGSGAPAVIRNAPLLDDGTPMPTRYWLVDPAARVAVGRLEAAGGVRRAESGLDPAEVAAAHARYAAERDAALPPTHRGPTPSGGVGGTRTGVKCLHAHYAWHLAGGDDPVGRWVAEQLPGRGREVTSSGGPVAAVDIGTNSVRLLVAEQGPGTELVTLERTMTITRLGAGRRCHRSARPGRHRPHGRGPGRATPTTWPGSASVPVGCAPPPPPRRRDAANRDRVLRCRATRRWACGPSC